MRISPPVAVVALILLGGCATGTLYSEARRQPQPKLAANEGRIFFYRASVYYADALQPDIVLNGQVVGRAVSGGYFTVDRPPGTYELSLDLEEKKLSFRLAAGEIKYFRVRLGIPTISGMIRFEEVSKGQAESDMSSLRQADAAGR